MAGDLYLEWGQDFVLTPDGDLQFAVGWDVVRQRILRHVCTCAQTILPSRDPVPADYIFDPAYGLGAPRLVDQNLTSGYLRRMRRLLLQGILEDPDVLQTPMPVVTFHKPAPPETLIVVVQVFLKSGQPGQVAIQM